MTSSYKAELITVIICITHIFLHGQRIHSLFTKYPEFQRKHFPSLALNEGDSTITKLRIHGAKVMGSIAVMVKHVKTGNDERLLQKIQEVRNACIPKPNIT